MTILISKTVIGFSTEWDNDRHCSPLNHYLSLRVTCSHKKSEYAVWKASQPTEAGKEKNALVANQRTFSTIQNRVKMTTRSALLMVAICD